MSSEEVNVDDEMVENLMAKGFGDPVLNRPHRNSKEVTATNLRHGEPVNDILKGAPFKPPVAPPPAFDFALWQCRVSDEAARSFAHSHSIDPSVY